MKNCFLFLSALFFFSCSSTKETQKTSKFLELDTATVQNFMREHSINVPKNWYSYLNSQKKLTHSPKALSLDKKDFTKVQVTIFKNDIKKCKCDNLKDLTKYFTDKLNNRYSDFKYDLVKGKHPIYDRYNFIIYKTKDYKSDYIILNALLIKENNYYEIRYKSLEKYYKKYADDVVKIIHSFKVNN